MTPKLRYLSIAVIVIILIQFGTAVATIFFLPDWTSRGQFGDLFGSVNGLFSGLAFAGLIYTIMLQREELGLQRNELELTRTELSRTAAAQELSEKSLKAQVEIVRDSGRMAAAEALLRHYRAELSRHEGVPYSAEDPRSTEVMELQARVQCLVAMMDGLFRQVTEASSSLSD